MTKTQIVLWKRDYEHVTGKRGERKKRSWLMREQLMKAEEKEGGRKRGVMKAEEKEGGRKRGVGDRSLLQIPCTYHVC
jgi:hypothetical protein